MARLTENERNTLRNMATQHDREPLLADEERFVSPTAQARARYIEFATQASRFFKGEKPVRFGGDNWKL